MKSPLTGPATGFCKADQRDGRREQDRNFFLGFFRSTGEKEFYRFHKPSDQSFPFMIELFSCKPGTLDWPAPMRWSGACASADQ
ncbi:hypothetical protein [Pseudaminobacter soli (ex Li et al. 2025)]|uniref:Uncharacterized protein n=1 Tax=Pseudaminobacter soli (ex Li et al. 2025) TaxID=1295366 RepID=A0A2P7S5C2_9HYPH|nr:hypothetical protein [Mesorhizobium soli]PSJ57632.1 hypothetical protein C7I85_21990 [Mesorhizobium soli]